MRSILDEIIKRNCKVQKVFGDIEVIKVDDIDLIECEEISELDSYSQYRNDCFVYDRKHNTIIGYYFTRYELAVKYAEETYYDREDF